MNKERVHNKLEAKVLIEEAYRRGDEDKYNLTNFYKHDGEYLFQCLIRLTEFELVLPNKSSETIEL